MRSFYLAALSSFLLLAFSGAVTAQINVAVEDGSPDGSGAGIVAQLNDDTLADFSAALVTADAIDTAGELAAYDVVILGGSGSQDADWTVAMADALAAWAQGGGGVILTGWGNFDMRSGEPQDETLAAIFPGDNINSVNDFVNSGETLTFVASHPVVDGLSDFALPTGCCTEVNPLPLETGDTTLATAGGDPAVIVNASGGGRSVYLGPVYMGSESGYASQFPALREGELDQLLEQAVLWAAQQPSAMPVPALPHWALLGLGLIIVAVGAGASRYRRGVARPV